MSAQKPLVALLLALLGTSASASAQDCAPVERPSDARLLRQLSLDLLDRIPTEAEYATVLAGQRPEDAIATMLASEEFFGMMRGYHRGLLWASEDPEELSTRELQIHRVGDSQVYYDANAGSVYRGAGNVSCVDIEHTAFDAEGHVIPLVERYMGGLVDGHPAPANAERCRTGSGCRLDGWVRVSPYWAPETTVKACAYDAQTAAVGVRGLMCEERGNDRGCGCGSTLERCVVRGGTAEEIADALEEEPLRIFERVMRDPSASYFDALTTRTTEINGPLATYYSHAASTTSHDASMQGVPELPFSETTFRSFERGPEHSGVLTTRAFLTRFASQRARANRFATAFLCQPFIAPSEGLPASDAPCSQNPNLSERCGCAACHQRLEPLAVHWGRWDINGDYGFFSTAQHPVRNPSCATCASGACSDACDTYYVTQTVSGAGEEANLGMLNVLAWRSPEEVAALDLGPAALVQTPSYRTAMQSCAATTLAERFLHRPLTVEESATWVPELAATFRDSGEHVQALVEAIVRDRRYLATR